jgi:hypothetical protein
VIKGDPMHHDKRHSLFICARWVRVLIPHRRPQIDIKLCKEHEVHRVLNFRVSISVIFI